MPQEKGLAFIRLRKAAVFFGLVSFVGGAISLLGWVFDIPRFADWVGSSIAIQPNTAVAIILAGAAALFLAFDLPKVGFAFGVLVTLVGASVIFEHRTGVDLGIDTLFSFGRDWDAGVTSPGRMGPPAATCWTLIGAAFMLIASSRLVFDDRREKAQNAAVALSLVTTAIAMLSTIGYLYGAKMLYTLPTITAIALQTSLLILAVNGALMALSPRAWLMRIVTEGGPAGVLFRRLAPAVFFLPIVLGVLRLAGERFGLYDLAFGSAARTLTEITLLLTLLVWAAVVVRREANAAAEQRRAADASERNFQQMAEAMPQVVWISDNLGRVHYFNQRVSTFAGVVEFPDGTFDWRPVISPEDLGRTVERWEEAIAAKKDFSVEHRIQTFGGMYRWHLSRAVPVVGDDGTIDLWYGTATDIHDLKIAEEELQVVNERLETRVHQRTQELAEANRSLVQEMEISKAMEAEKIDLMRRLVNSQEVERSRIARDMHDQLGQRLTALRLKLTSLRQIAASDGVITQRVARLQEIAEGLDTEISFLAWELRPTALDDLGLAEALSTYVDEWSRHYEIAAEFHSSYSAGQVPTDTKIQLYRIAQEALNNIAKYARARHVTVLLERRENGLVMIIEDDGIGFDVDITSNAGIRKGFGLLGMRERAALVMGDLEVESAPGAGTTVYIRVPDHRNVVGDIHRSVEPMAS